MAPQVTDAPPKTPPGEKPPESPEQRQLAQNSAVLRGDLTKEDYKNFTEASLTASGQRPGVNSKAFGEQSESLNLDHNKLWSKSSDQLALNTSNRDLAKLSDRLSNRQSDRVPTLRKVDSNYEPAERDCLSALKERYKGDQTTCSRLEQGLKAVKDTVLPKQVRIEDANGKVRPDGPVLDQKNTYREFCENLAHFARNAETARTDDGQPVYNQRWQVDELIADALTRGADPTYKSDQVGPTCAIERINGLAQGMAVGSPAARVGEAMRTGRMTLLDPVTHEKFTTHVDLASFRPLVKGQGAYRQAMEVTTAQANLAYIARDEARRQKLPASDYNDFYTYKHVNPVNRADPGIRIAANTESGKLMTPANPAETIGRDPSNGELVLMDSQTGKPVTYPETHQFSLGRTVQGLIGDGDHISGDFADKMVFLNGKKFAGQDIQFGMKIHSGKQLVDQTKNNEANGWENALFMHNALHYAGSGQNAGDGGGHVVAIASGTKEGTLRTINQWNGRHNYDNLSPETAFAWMDDPVGQPMINRPGGGGIYYPVGPGSHNYNEGTHLVDRDKNKTPGSDEDQHRKEREAITAQAQKEQEQKALNENKQKQWLSAQAEQARAQVAALEHELASANGDPEKISRIQAQKQFLLHQGQTLSA